MKKRNPRLVLIRAPSLENRGLKWLLAEQPVKVHEPGSARRGNPMTTFSPLPAAVKCLVPPNGVTMQNLRHGPLSGPALRTASIRIHFFRQAREY